MGVRVLKGYTTCSTASESQTFEAGTSEEDIPDWAKETIRRDDLWIDLDQKAAKTGYENMTVKELYAEVKRRNIHADSNKKADLIQTLEDHDAGQPV
jgi:uncharacterized protein YaeQ